MKTLLGIAILIIAQLTPPIAAADRLRVDGARESVEIDSIQAAFDGTRPGDELSGESSQGGQALPHRPQRIDRTTYQEIVFDGTDDGVQLTGVLSIPTGQGPFPAALLLSGTGPQDRDSTFFNYKPFEIIAESLTAMGYVVLRYDDRGQGGSGGDFSLADFDTVLGDARAALNRLRRDERVDPTRLVAIGHSEGGVVAARLAADSLVHGVVLLNTPALDGRTVARDQVREIGVAEGLPANLVQANVANMDRLVDSVLSGITGPEFEALLDQMLSEYAEQLPAAIRAAVLQNQDAIKNEYRKLDTVWYRSFLRLNPAPILERVRVPLLVLAGGRDTQVNARANVEQIEASASKARNTQVTVEIIDDVNHLLQRCSTGHPMEYATSGDAVSPDVLRALTTWIRGLDSNVPLVR